MMPAMQGGDQASMPWLPDPAGAAIGLWQPHQHRGFGVIGEAGAPVWHEAMSRNYDAALPFYVQVFGWTLTTLEDSDQFRYSTASLGGDPFAGVMDASAILPEDVPSFWQFYIGVGDVDASLARAKKLAGSLVRGHA